MLNWCFVYLIQLHPLPILEMVVTFKTELVLALGALRLETRLMEGKVATAAVGQGGRLELAGGGVAFLWRWWHLLSFLGLYSVSHGGRDRNFWFRFDKFIYFLVVLHSFILLWSHWSNYPSTNSLLWSALPSRFFLLLLPVSLQAHPFIFHPHSGRPSWKSISSNWILVKIIRSTASLICSCSLLLRCIRTWLRFLFSFIRPVLLLSASVNHVHF